MHIVFVTVRQRGQTAKEVLEPSFPQTSQKMQHRGGFDVDIRTF